MIRAVAVAVAMVVSSESISEVLDEGQVFISVSDTPSPTTLPGRSGRRKCTLIWRVD
jgi:hypothetical protein